MTDSHRFSVVLHQPEYTVITRNKRRSSVETPRVGRRPDVVTRPELYPPNEREGFLVVKAYEENLSAQCCQVVSLEPMHAELSLSEVLMSSIPLKPISRPPIGIGLKKKKIYR